MLKNIYLLINILSNNLFLKPKFKRFGKRVVYLKPRMITNPQYIEIEDDVFIREYSRIEAIDSYGVNKFTPALKIKRGVHIEQFFHVGVCEYVEIGENVLIAGRVYISDHNHRFTDVSEPVKMQGIERGGRVIIGKNSWLCEGCTILPGVTIGRNSIIGAGAVITKNVPPYSVVVGNPAKIVKQYDFSDKTWKSSQ